MHGGWPTPLEWVAIVALVVLLAFAVISLMTADWNTLVWDAGGFAGLFLWLEPRLVSHEDKQ